MPSTGTPLSKRPVSHQGAPGAETLIGPPDRMIPAGAFARIFSFGVLNGTISE
jgi:hypothetical protein